MDRDRTLRLFVVAVALGAASAVPLLLLEVGSADLALTLGLALGAALAGAFPVRVPARRLDVTSSHPFVLAALAVAGPLAAIAVDVAGVLAAACGRGRRPLPIHFAFNLANAVLSASAAWWTFALLDGVLGAPINVLILPFGGAAVTYFFVNAGLVSVAICLERGLAFSDTFARACAASGLSFFAGGSAAVAMLAVIDISVFLVLVVGLPPCWALTVLHRSQVREAGLDLSSG